MGDIRTSVGDLLAHLLEDALVVVAVEELVAGVLVLANLVGLETGRLEDNNQAAGVFLLGRRLGHLGCLGHHRDVGSWQIHL